MSANDECVLLSIMWSSKTEERKLDPLPYPASFDIIARTSPIKAYLSPLENYQKHSVPPSEQQVTPSGLWTSSAKKSASID